MSSQSISPHLQLRSENRVGGGRVALQVTGDEHADVVLGVSIPLCWSPAEVVHGRTPD